MIEALVGILAGAAFGAACRLSPRDDWEFIKTWPTSGLLFLNLATGALTIDFDVDRLVNSSNAVTWTLWALWDMFRFFGLAQLTGLPFEIGGTAAGWGSVWIVQRLRRKPVDEAERE